MKALERCPKCNAMIALVGRVHNCRNPVLAELAAPPVKKPVVKDAGKEDRGKDPPTRGVRSSSKFDRVAYQREYMRERRAKEKMAKAK